MKRLLQLTFALSISTAAMLAAPSIASPGVYNSASYALSAFPNGGIAQGSIFVIFGTGMGPSTIAYNSSLPYQTSLSGTSVGVTVNGTTVACLMFYTSAGQVAAILPSNTPVGTGTVTVTYNGSASNAAAIKVVAAALGLFTRNQQGSGPAVVQDSSANYNALTFAFQPGETVTFWGTGLGAISGSDANTPPSGPLPGNPQVAANIGGQNAVVQYAGRSGYAGEDQINVTIPTGVSGCYVPVYITVNGIPSNFVSISVGSGTVCSDPSLYTSTQLQNVINNGSLRVGGVQLTQFQLTVPISIPGFTIPPEDSESGNGTFTKYDATSFLSSFGGFSTIAVSSGCAVYQFSGSSFADPVQGAGLDAGAVINVTGPNGTKPLTKQSTGEYSATFVTPSLNPLAPPPTPFLTPGNYTLDNGAGGTDVGAFKVNLTVPQALTWTNKSQVTTVNRSQNLTLTWTGGSGSVYIIGESPLSVTSSGGFQGAGEFVCVAPASLGTFTVPSAVLSALPASANISESGISLGGGIITLNSISETSANISGLDVFLAGASTGDGKIGVTFQ